MNKNYCEAKRKSCLINKDIAELTGIPYSTLKHYSSGWLKTEKAALLPVLKIALTFDCSLADLLEDEDAIALARKYDRMIKNA